MKSTRQPALSIGPIMAKVSLVAENKSYWAREPSARRNAANEAL